MSVETVLEKIVAHNTDVLGCLLLDRDMLYKTLPERYELVAGQDVGEHIRNIFLLMAGLETEEPEFQHLFLEFEHHSLYALRIGDGVLTTVNHPIKRAHRKKLEVGVSLFVKPLQRALEDHAPAPEPAPTEAETAQGPDPVEDPASPPKPKRMYRGIEY